MDATRQRDGKQVMLKRVSTARELGISQLVSSPLLRHDPRNHCVPLLEVIGPPDAHDQTLVVMPLLRPFDQPRFQTFGEFVAFFTQICGVRSTHHLFVGVGALTILDPGQGLHFMHKQNIAHRYVFACLYYEAPTWNPPSDCTASSIMLDPTGMHPHPTQWRNLIMKASRDGILTNIKFDPSGMYPNGFHPVQLNRSKDFKGRAKRYTRTQRPTRYYLVDFGLSCQYDSRNSLDDPLPGGDNSAPEQQLERPCNPFHTDIYDFGNVIRERFLEVSTEVLVSKVVYTVFQVSKGFEFMIGLVDAMTDEGPEQRPVIEDVISRFSRIRNSLSGFKLRSPITPKQDPSLFTTLRYARQAVRTARYIISRNTAIPNA